MEYHDVLSFSKNSGSCDVFCQRRRLITAKPRGCARFFTTAVCRAFKEWFYEEEGAFKIGPSRRSRHLPPGGAPHGKRSKVKAPECCSASTTPLVRFRPRRTLAEGMERILWQCAARGVQLRRWQDTSAAQRSGGIRRGLLLKCTAREVFYKRPGRYKAAPPKRSSPRSHRSRASGAPRESAASSGATHASKLPPISDRSTQLATAEKEHEWKPRGACEK